MHIYRVYFSHGGVKPFCYLCDWLEERGVTED